MTDSYNAAITWLEEPLRSAVEGPLAGRTLLVRFCDELAIEVIPFTSEHWPLALDAFQRFGKGRHKAALNFGDCLTYAIAHHATRPLLCLGDDFPQTDLDVISAN